MTHVPLPTSRGVGTPADRKVVGTLVMVASPGVKMGAEVLRVVAGGLVGAGAGSTTSEPGGAYRCARLLNTTTCGRTVYLSRFTGRWSTHSQLYRNSRMSAATTTRPSSSNDSPSSWLQNRRAIFF